MNRFLIGAIFTVGLWTSLASAADQTQEELYVNLHWCYWHEGERIYTDGEPGSMRDPNSLRTDCINKQQHNPHAIELLKAASNDLIEALSQRAVLSNEAEHQMWQNFSWCGYHENLRQTFRDELSRNDFNGIRSTYYNCQAHNPNTKHLLAELSNAHLRVMVNRL
jgi:hypothetical protein